MPDIKKVLIIGPGTAGLAAAILLRRKNGISCTIYEIHPEPTTLGGAIGIPCNGLRLLDHLGVYEQLLTLAATTPMTTLFSSQGNELGELNFGAWAWNKTWYEFVCVMRTYLQDVMLDTARKEGVQIQYDKKMVSIEGSDREVTVNFSDGTKDTADLLLGCDGIHFSVQTLYIDPQTVPEYSGISTVFSFVPMSDLLPTASAITDIHFIMTPDGAVALMPWTASGATLFWFFSYQVTVPASGNTRDGWEEHRGAEVEGFKTTLLKILQGVEGDCGTLKTGCESYRNCEILPYFQTPFWWEVVQRAVSSLW